MRNGKNSTEMGFLGKYLNAICQDYVEKFQEIRAKHAGGTLEQARDVTSDIQKITDDMTPKCPSDSPEHAELHPAQDTPKPGTDSETPPGSEESSADLEHSSEMPAISELQPEAPPTSPFGLDSSELSPDIDALDILALLIVEKMGIKNADVAASRAFLSILIENEHLPVAGQLSAQELQALRNLLFCYFSGDANVNEKGAQVLALIEQKFANGFFSQARILLQIFETNQETRQNNERNLYYEEMILRLDGGPTKAKPVARNILQAACEDDADDETVLRALRAIEHQHHVQSLPAQSRRTQRMAERPVTSPPAHARLPSRLRACHSVESPGRPQRTHRLTARKAHDVRDAAAPCPAKTPHVLLYPSGERHHRV